MKKVSISFVSGLSAIILFLSSFITVQPELAFATESDELNDGVVATEDVENEPSVREAVYECEEDVIYETYEDYCSDFYDGYWESEGTAAYDAGYDAGQEAYYAGYELEDRYGYDDSYNIYDYDLEDKSEAFLDGFDNGYREHYSWGYEDGYYSAYYEDNHPVTEDAYHNIYDNVTGEVYKSYQINTENFTQVKNKQGNAELFGARKVQIDSDAIEQIKDFLIVHTPQGTTVKFPKKALEQILGKDGYDIFVTIGNDSAKYKDALSEAIKFEIYNDNGKFGGKNNKLDQPVIVTFKVDPKKVKNWNDLVLRYVDEEGKVTDYTDQIISWNSETGEVVAEIYHFSTYYIAEKPGSGASKGLGVNVKENKAPEEGQRLLDTATEDEENKASEEGQRLPDTATNTFNYLTLGAVLILIGSIPLVLRRKQSI